MLKNILITIGVVLLILTAVFYFGHILANLIMGLLIIGVLAIVVGLLL